MVFHNIPYLFNGIIFFLSHFLSNAFFIASVARTLHSPHTFFFTIPFRHIRNYTPYHLGSFTVYMYHTWPHSINIPFIFSEQDFLYCIQNIP